MMKNLFKVIFIASIFSITLGVMSQTEDVMAACSVRCSDFNAIPGGSPINAPPSGSNVEVSISGPTYRPPGGQEYAADESGNPTPSREYGGGMVRTRTETTTHPDGSKTIVITPYSDDCGNPLDPIVQNVPAPAIPGDSGGGGGGGGGCPCGTSASKPSPDPKPADAPYPGDQHDSGYATAAAYVNGSRASTFNADDLASRNPDGTYNMVTLTPEQAQLIYQGGDQATAAVAKPHDRIAIRTVAKGAYISGYTTDSYAKVTNNLNTGGDSGSAETAENRSGNPITLDHGERVAVAADVGKVFTGTAYARPLQAHLTWSANYGSYVRGHTPNTSTCSYREACGEDCDTDEDGDEHCSTIYCSRSCSYISSWSQVMGSYISSWSPNYSDSGEANKQAHLMVPHNYDIEIPPIAACDTEGNPPCAEWPNYGITYPGEDREFQHSMKINTVNGYATNTKPSTYEIITFVTTADSGKPSGPGNGAFRTSAPGVGDSCGHYTAGTFLARSCVVVQREQDIYFNTNDGNPNSVKLDGKTDYSSYDVAGNALRSLNPNIVIDDLPAGSKICVALSVWPNDYTGLDRDFTGSTWLHGTPYCLTIAKKPSTQFWGAGVFSAGDITTSQSVKYVPDANGFTASGSNNGRSDGLPTSCSGDPSSDEYKKCVLTPIRDNSARRAFGSWSEYEAISSRNIKGLATGAALGYEGPYGKNFLAPSGGFPTAFPASNSFTKDRLCNYSSQTFANSISSECRDSYTMGNSNILTNVDLTLDRLISRYATTSDNPTTDITIGIGGDTPQSTSDDKNTQSYSSNAANVTLRTNSAIPAGNTITVTVPGKLTIASNIEYPNANYTNIADLPQVLIFADSIDILPSVSRVDAWLVVGQHSTSSTPSPDSGVLNTCAGFNVGTSGINSCDAHPLDDRGVPDKKVPGLTINGPVFTEKLALNRTAGAGAGHDSITPAERFNLRADAYLWSYAQAQRYSQAVVTYSRELAPRY